jgi:hypothetical protein
MMRAATPQHQGGLVALLLAAAILTTVATTMVISQATAVRKAGDQIGITNLRLELIRSALVNYVIVNKRLPCPASGAVDDGQPIPANPTVAPNYLCTNQNGTVPWSVLGLTSSGTVDAWGRKISYRVYDGAPGLAIADGADMSACDSVIGAPVPPVPPFFLCNALHNTSAPGFLSAVNRPGLTVADDALVANVTQVGFVLISHGPTGLGAWLLGGGCPAPGCRMALPPAPLSNPERPNTQAPGAGVVYVKRVNSDKTVTTVDSANFFDDQVVYMTIVDLLNAAGRGARNW